MGWSLRLRLGNRAASETPEGIGAALAAATIEAANGLAAKLEEEGLAWLEPERFRTEAFRLECVLFEWFLRDLVIPVAFPSHAEAIRRLLAGDLVLDLLRSGIPSADLSDLERLQGARFAEYAEACRRSESLQPFGALAWMRILGREEPSDRATVYLARRATAELRALEGMGKGYRVREGRPRLREKQ